MNKQKLKKLCPICNKLTVEWMTTAEEIEEIEDTYDVKVLQRDVPEGFLEGGSWICNYNEGGCGSSSGHKNSNKVYTWSREEQ